MADEVSEVTSTGLGGNLIDSIKSMLLGPVVILACIVGIFMLESKYVNNARSINEVFELAMQVVSDKVNPSAEGKPIYTTGKATTTDVLDDPVFGVSGQYIHLKRKAEMYQWIEDKETKEESQLGGGTKKVTTYKYKKDWDETHHDSSEFKTPTGHENPAMPYQSATKTAQNVTMGAYKLGPDYIDQVDKFEGISLDASAAEKLPAELKDKTKASSTGFYIGNDPAVPVVGDIRVSFEGVNPTEVSVVGAQSNGMVVPYQAKAGKQQIKLLDLGTVPMEGMKTTAVSENKMFVWIGRLVGLIAIAIGFNTIFKPLVAVGNIIPFIGNIVGAGAGFVSFLLSLAVTTTTIAIAWLTFRPLISIPLLVLAIGAIVYAKQRGKVPATG